MNLKKKLNDKNDTRVSAWYFDSDAKSESGIALGSYIKDETIMKCIAAIGNFNGQKKLIINDKLAKELGFEIVYE